MKRVSKNNLEIIFLDLHKKYVGLLAFEAYWGYIAFVVHTSICMSLPLLVNM